MQVHTKNLRLLQHFTLEDACLCLIVQIRRYLSMLNSTEHADPYQEPKTITSFIEKGRSF